MKKPSIIGTAVASAAILAVAGCSSKASDSGNGSGSGDVKTDFGVTEETITLGVQSDLSGIFKSIGLALTHGNELWVADANAAGGICGREIVLDIKDNAYKPDNAMPIYEQQKADILGYMQLIGTPILNAVKQKVIADNILAVPAAPASINLDSENVLILGVTYDVEMINGLSYLYEQGRIADGDKIGHIYIDSEYGQNGLLGSKHFAKEHDMTVIEAPVSGADNDMTSTITKFKAEGVKAIALTVAPNATGSAVMQAAAQGMDIPVIGNNSSFTPNLLKDPGLAQALSKNYYAASGYLPYGADGELAQKIQQEYEKKFSADEPNYAVNAGYIEGIAWGALLEHACEAGDLTRAGIITARGEIDTVGTQGVTGALSLAANGEPGSRESLVQQPDAGIPGGVKVISGLTASEEAKSYQTPHQK